MVHAHTKNSTQSKKLKKKKPSLYIYYCMSNKNTVKNGTLISGQ